MLSPDSLIKDKENLQIRAGLFQRNPNSRCDPANSPADFEGKDPGDPEFRALRDYLAEKRRKWEARKKEIGRKSQEGGKGKKADPKRLGRKRDKPEDDGERSQGTSDR
jgi:hypothetical protein